MSDRTPINELMVESSKRGRDPKTRAILLALLVLWLVTLAALLGVAWNAYFHQKADTQSLAEQITIACKSGDFGPGLDATEEQKKLCSKAKEITQDNSLSLGIQGPRGPQGPQGVQGIQGLPGPQGLQGIMGKVGHNGKNGLNGTNGLPGPPGPKGDTGDTGPKGDKGDTGDKGADGTPAVPFTFQFTVPGNGLSPGTTYTCTITDPNSNVTCQEVQ